MNKKWAALEFSKKEIQRAGVCLVDPSGTAEDIELATVRLDNWRAVHAYPMHAVLMLLRNKAAKIDRKAIVAQRLKRSTSILLKLERFKSMKLNRMQDIAGCRAVVGNQRQVSN